jgi:hypothetical protein
VGPPIPYGGNASAGSSLSKLDELSLEDSFFAVLTNYFLAF